MFRHAPESNTFLAHCREILAPIAIREGRLQSRDGMRYAYYEKLSAREKAVYRRSDEVVSLDLPEAGSLHGHVVALRQALLADVRAAVQTAAAGLALGISQQLGIPRVELAVLAVRPSSSWGELHGLYTREPGRTPQIQLWMRTARHRRVVAFRTFLRTLLHEVGHHLDYELLRLGESFHTEGFFRRESSLFKQLVPEPERPGRASRRGQESPSPRPGRK
jgi:hypothetical protein